MALDKGQTKLWVKIVIGFLAISMVALFTPGIIGMFTSDGDDTATSAEANMGTLDAIAASYQPTILSYEDALQSGEASATAYVGLGNAYFDWAIEVQGAASQGLVPTGADTSLWLTSVTYYEQAVAAGDSTPQVLTDMAVAQFYSGDTEGAIASVEQALAESPDFLLAHYNAGIFLADAGRTDEAIVAFERYIELDPGDSPERTQYVQDQLAQLEAGGQ
jgi:tetratricopeptide (TPR) repeat protein